MLPSSRPRGVQPSTVIVVLTAGAACLACGTLVDLPSDGYGANDAASAAVPASSNARDGSAANDAAGAAVPASSDYRRTVLSDAPLGYYRLGETSGTVAATEVGTFSGAVFGAPTMGVPGAIAGDANTAFDFAGAGPQGIEVAGAFDFVGTASFSLEAWMRVRTGGVDGSYRHVVMKDNAAGVGSQVRDDYGIYVQSFDGLVFERYVQGARRAVGVPLPAVEQWHHVVATYDGRALALYVDGVLAATTADSRQAAPKTPAFTIGVRYDRTATFPGDLDEIAVYDHALTADRAGLHARIGRGQ